MPPQEYSLHINFKIAFFIEHDCILASRSRYINDKQSTLLHYFKYLKIHSMMFTNASESTSTF